MRQLGAAVCSTEPEGGCAGAPVRRTMLEAPAAVSGRRRVRGTRRPSLPHGPEGIGPLPHGRRESAIER